jgi:hypothetical protein
MLQAMIALATAATLIGELPADAVARATAHSGWDGLGGRGAPNASDRNTRRTQSGRTSWPSANPPSRGRHLVPEYVSPRPAPPPP